MESCSNANGSKFGKAEVFSPAGLVAYAEGAVVSRTVVESGGGTVTLFAFAEGQGLSEHTAPFDALVNVLDGEVKIAIAGKPHLLKSGESIFMPANIPHALSAVTAFKMMLVMSKEHPLAAYEDIPYHMLSGYTEILHGDFQVPSLSFAEINKNEGMTSPAKRIYVYDRGSQLELLRHTPGTYLWVAPIPQEILDGHNLVLRHCGAANMVNRDMVVYPKAQPPTGLCAELIAEMRRVTEKLQTE